MDGDTTPQAHNAAPTSPASEGAASEATQGGVKGTGKPGGHGKAGRVPHRERHRRDKAAKEASRSAAMDAVSRARALSEVCAEVSGAYGPPIPLAIACAVHGLSVYTVRAMLERGDAPDLEAARARGIAIATRAACGDGPDARQWAWLAERLAPKELHLPTRITGVPTEDGGAPIASVQVTLSRDEAMQLARGQVPTLPQQVQARALPKSR